MKTRDLMKAVYPGSKDEASIRGDVRIITRNILVVATRTVGGWKAYIGIVEGRDHSKEWKTVLEFGDTVPESLARFLYPEFKDAPYDR